MAGFFKRLFGRRDDVPAVDIEAMLDWSPGPPPPPPAFHVAPPPPPPPVPAGDDPSALLWGTAPSLRPTPPPPPPIQAPPKPPPPPPAGPKVRLMLADGTVVHPPAGPEFQRLAYLARNLLPPGYFRSRPLGPKVSIVLDDGTVLEGAEDHDLQARIEYAARNLLPRRR